MMTVWSGPRQELDARVAQIFVENALSSEQYGIITLVISQNEEVRAVFEQTRGSSA